MHARFCGSKRLLALYQIINPDFPSLADEIAEPHPYINIKVAAFTVSEKSNNTFFFRRRTITVCLYHGPLVLRSHEERFGCFRFGCLFYILGGYHNHIWIGNKTAPTSPSAPVKPPPPAPLLE